MLGHQDGVGIGQLRRLTAGARAARLLPLALLLGPGPAAAPERDRSIGSFDRLRVAGPFEVRVETGRPPAARIEADDALIDRIEVAVEGDTLVVRMGHEGWGETPAGRAGKPPVVSLSTPALRSIAVSAGARVVAGRVAGERVNLAVNGAGAIAVASARADELDATVVGAGALSVAGTALRARLLTNGPGAIDAGDLAASDLVVRLDGPGETRARARYTARVTDTGVGRVTVLGEATCVVTAIAGGPVACGRAR